MDNYYPIYLKLNEKKCLVVGGGKVAERKVKKLLDCGARVYVVSPDFTRWLETIAEDGKIVIVRRSYSTTDLENAFIVIGATDDDRINIRVAEDCNEKNIPVNIADDSSGCSFIVPAVLRQGALSISVSTDGKSPMLAQRIREELEPQFGIEYDAFLELMGKVREHVVKNIPGQEKRKEIFYQLVYSDIIDLLREGRHEIVKERINHVLGGGWTQS